MENNNLFSYRNNGHLVFFVVSLIFIDFISVYVQLMRIFSFLNNQKGKIKQEAALTYSGRLRRS